VKSAQQPSSEKVVHLSKKNWKIKGGCYGGLEMAAMMGCF